MCQNLSCVTPLVLFRAVFSVAFRANCKGNVSVWVDLFFTLRAIKGGSHWRSSGFRNFILNQPFSLYITFNLLRNHFNSNYINTVKMPDKLTEDSEAVKLIRAGFQSGIIKQDMTAKAVWSGHPKFMEYKLDTFRTRFNKIKQEMRESTDIPDRKFFFRSMHWHIMKYELTLIYYFRWRWGFWGLSSTKYRIRWDSF